MLTKDVFLFDGQYNLSGIKVNEIVCVIFTVGKIKFLAKKMIELANALFINFLFLSKFPV